MLSVKKMPIKNETTNKVIATSSKTANSMLTRSIGLMFSKSEQAALILRFNKEEKISLHMMFVFYPIDVIFVNKRKQVVDVKENLRPFDTYSSTRKALYAIELPIGTIRSTKTKVGHKITFLRVKETHHLNGKSIIITKARK
ncbi:hypothetical protein CMO88_01225 [Candidatus Woesearchaeota archaeon]|nr:hypothetical protein [Candidatus Woesearchaeota archaeon]|tara:strand:- start:3831 stop:4256 length:426 start_codon:yes stop_codon:yes gene_type:complete